MTFVILVSAVMAFLIGIAPLLQRDIGEIIGIDFTGFPEYYVYFLAGAAGTILMGIALVNPLWGIIIVMFLLPFRSEEYALMNISGAIIRPSDPVALFAFIGLLNRDIFSRKEGLPLVRAGFELPLLTFTWWVFLSITWCESYSSAVSKLLQYSYAIVLLYMVLALIRKKEHLIAGMYAWILGGVILGSLALIDTLSSTGSSRSAALETSALETGEYLNYPILMGIGLYMIAKNKLTKLFVLSCVSLMLTATLLSSASRGPLIGLACALIFFYFFCDRFRTYTHWLIPVGVFGTILAFFALGLFKLNLIDLTEEVFRRFIELIEYPQSDPGLAYRLNIWSAIWTLYLQHPILGLGVGSLSQVLPEYTMAIFQDPELAHNMYLEVFIAVGPFGMLLFFWFMWRILKFLARYLFDKSDYVLHLLFMSLLAAQVAKAVGNLTFGMFFEDRVEWVAIAMCFAAIQMFKKREGTAETREETAEPALPEKAS